MSVLYYPIVSWIRGISTIFALKYKFADPEEADNCERYERGYGKDTCKIVRSESRWIRNSSYVLGWYRANQRSRQIEIVWWLSYRNHQVRDLHHWGWDMWSKGIILGTAQTQLKFIDWILLHANLLKLQIKGCEVARLLIKHILSKHVIRHRLTSA